MNAKIVPVMTVNHKEAKAKCAKRTEKYRNQVQQPVEQKQTVEKKKTVQQKQTYKNQRRISFDRDIMDNRGQYKHLVHMMGVPFRATYAQIREFFEPLNVVDVRIIRDGGRPTGEVDVAFGSQEDVQEAMGRNRNYLGERWVKLINVSSGRFDSRWGNVADIDFSQEYRNQHRTAPIDFNRRERNSGRNDSYEGKFV